MVELSASEALRLGVEAHKKGDEKTAELYYLAILKVDPLNADANHNVGVLRLSKGQNLDALAYFEKALDRNNTVLQFWISLIDTLLKLEQYKDALEKINLAQKHGLSDAQITYYRDKIEPNLNITEKNGIESNKRTNILQSIKLDHAFSLAQKKMRDGFNEEAKNIYKDIIEKFPKNKRAHAQLRLLNKDQSKVYLSDKLKKLFSLYKAGEYDAVLSQATNLRKKYGEEHALINLCAAANAGLEKYDSAIKDHKKALKLMPNFYETFYNLGTIYQKLDMLDDAIAAYQNTLRLDPKNILASYNLANTFYTLGKLKDAASSYETTIDLDPKYAEAHHNLGVTFQKMGKLEKSIECYQNALKIKPNYPEVLNACGVAYKDLGALGLAMDAYTSALEINSNFQPAKSNLTGLLKIYSPRNLDNPLIKLDAEIKEKRLDKFTHRSDLRLAEVISRTLFKMKSTDPMIQASNSQINKASNAQIYRRSTQNLNCERHHDLFFGSDIIPEFCFACYKVQIDVVSVLDLIRLQAIFYKIEFNRDLIRKCMIEMRDDVSGFYKGFVYCASLKEAQDVKLHLDFHIKETLGKTFTSHIKRGCSEYSLSFPQYAEISEDDSQSMKYPQKWKKIEQKFELSREEGDICILNPSEKTFCLDDFLIIEQWIDYARGLEDPSYKYFTKHNVNYHDIFNIAKERKKKFFVQ